MRGLLARRTCSPFRKPTRREALCAPLHSVLNYRRSTSRSEFGRHRRNCRTMVRQYRRFQCLRQLTVVSQRHQAGRREIYRSEEVRILFFGGTYDHKINSEQKWRRNMKEKQIRLPGPDHPISIQRNPARVVVSAAGEVIANTGNALTLREADYPAVQYIPSEDVDFSQLERTDHATYCPYKGECSYYSISAGERKCV